MMTKAVFFDLDNTLYDAEQYFLGAFEIISKHVSLKYNISEERVYKKLVRLWREKTSMYPYLFDDLANLFHLDRDSPKELVAIFNQYHCRLEPYPDVMPTLGKLKETGYRLGIITDGDVARQKRKIASLGLEPLFALIIYAKEIEPKPSSSTFLIALDKLKVKASDTFYVADNPLLDFRGAKEAGMSTVRIMIGEFAKVPGHHDIDFEITDLTKLLDIIG